MNIDFLAPAEAEFVEITAYYNSQSEGLGFEFAHGNYGLNMKIKNLKTKSLYCGKVRKRRMP